ncbi:MAG: DUF4419 domain-containing protein [Sphingobacteriales bacterium]|nr:MAG: DUF4419 domain-containing protein [Sphingobacteriales bacterium]
MIFFRLLLSLFVVILLTVPAIGQRTPGKGLTFAVEKLERPKALLDELPADTVVKRISPLALAHSEMSGRMVDQGAHPFFNGMYQAYADHRPFELSPDMIWLLICQGFAHHVNNNAEALRSMFVDFEGKEQLTAV